MDKSTEDTTFRQLDGNVDTGTPKWPLEIWYEEVRDIPLSRMEVKDLARACRQKIDLELIVPLCLAKLEENPLAGELYDGEMVAAVKQAGSAYWQAHPAERKRFLELADRALEENLEQELPFPEWLLISEADLLK